MEDDQTQEIPAESENEESLPQSEDAAPKEGDGFQKRISELTRKRREAEREAAYWRGRAESMPSTPPKPLTPAPKELDPSDFDSDSDYLKAVAAQTREEILAEQRAEREREQEARTKEALSQTLTSSRAKYDDFDEVALNPSIQVSPQMYQAALGDNLGDILYHLGKNPAEAARIAALTPFQQAKEIGKIEVRLTSSPPPKVTGAPPPPSKVGGAGKPPTKKETDMSRAELHAKWEAERRAGLGR